MRSNRLKATTKKKTNRKTSIGLEIVGEMKRKIKIPLNREHAKIEEPMISTVAVIFLLLLLLMKIN